MADAIRFGIIGCGQVSRVGHGPGIRSDKRARLVAVADPDDANRKTFQRMFTGLAAYADHRAMLERERLDAVVIASPPWLHAEHVRDSTDARLHILCEKPLAPTVAECQAIVAMAEHSDRIVQIGHSKRFETGFQQIKQWSLDPSFFGDLYQMSIAWHYYIPDFTQGWLKRGLEVCKALGVDLEKKYGTWRYFNPQAGGGDLFDHGPHYIDLVRFIFGEIESVMCTTRRFYPVRLFEDLAVMVLNLANGGVVVMEKSNMVLGRPNGFERGHIYAQNAKVFFEAYQEYIHKPMKLKHYHRANILPDLYAPVRLPKGIKNTLYFRQMRHFIDRICGVRNVTYDGEWSATAHDGMLAVAWTLAAYRSAREGRAVHKEELFTV